MGVRFTKPLIIEQYDQAMHWWQVMGTTEGSEKMQWLQP